MELFHLLIYVVLLTYLGSKMIPHFISTITCQCFCSLISRLDLVYSIRFDELCSLVFVISQFPPLVESVQLKLSALRSMLLEECGLGPLISEVLIPGDGVVLLLSQGCSFHARSSGETGRLVARRQWLRGLGPPLETSLEIGILMNLWIGSGL